MNLTFVRPAIARLAVLAVAPVLCLASACGGGSDTGSRSAPEPDPSLTPSPVAPAGPQRLKTVAPLTVDGYKTSAIAYRYRQPLPSQVQPRRAGYVYAGLEVRVCVDDGPAPMEVSWEGWSVTYVDSTTVEPVGAWSDDWFSVPLFPGSGFEKSVRVGRCVQGWIVFEARGGARPDLAEYTPDDAAAGPAWNL